MTSLRRTALLWMTALMVAVGVVSFAVVYELARREAADFLDGQLRQIALNAGDGPAFSKSSSTARDPEDEFVIEIWTVDGTVVRRSPGAPAVPRAPVPGFSVAHADGETWRVYLAEDGRRAVQVSQSMEVRQEMAASAALQAGVPILILIPLTWLVMIWSIGNLARRLRRLADDVARRSLTHREPIPVDGLPSEARPLVEGMNTLTGRLQDALDRQKRFVADAAHELRTPLTALQLQLDELDTREGTSDAEALARMGAGLRRARRLVEQLLRLARSEEGAPGQAHERVDLRALVTQCVADHVLVASERGVDLGMVAADAVSVAGSSAELGLLFGNLIDNAVRYTPQCGGVDVSVRREGKSFAVEVADTGPGVTEADIPRLFDRFFRAAPPDVEGSGLGLSIAAAVVRRHGFTLSIRNRTDRCGLLARVEGPTYEP